MKTSLQKNTIRNTDGSRIDPKKQRKSVVERIFRFPKTIQKKISQKISLFL